MVALDSWFLQILGSPSAPLGAALAQIATAPCHDGLDPRIRTAALTSFAVEACHGAWRMPGLVLLKRCSRLR